MGLTLQRNAASAGLVLFLALLPAHVSAQWVQVGSDIDGEAGGDRSGSSVSLSSNGTRVAIGAPDGDGNGSASGHVRVYQWGGLSWTQIGPDLDGEAAEDNSGFSVSLSSDGTRVAIGAPRNSGSGTSSGHVRVFEWVGTASNWIQAGSDIDGDAAHDWCGCAVSLSADGSRVAIGALGDGDLTGHVRVYEWVGASWVQMGADMDGEAVGDTSGSSVSLSADGTRVAIGAPGNDDGGDFSGHVRVYGWVGGNWVQMGSDIDGEAAGDFSGASVSLSSSDPIRVAIGAPGTPPPPEPVSGPGHVRVYEWVSTVSNWIQVGADIDGEATGDEFGSSVSLSSDGSRLAIGARQNDGGGAGSGHVRVFAWGGGEWFQVGSDIDGEAAGDQSGSSVSCSSNGAVVAVGAPENDGGGNGSGQVRVYGNAVLFVDGFESGTTSRWSSQVPAR